MEQAATYGEYEAYTPKYGVEQGRPVPDAVAPARQPISGTEDFRSRFASDLGSLLLSQEYPFGYWKPVYAPCITVTSAARTMGLTVTHVNR